MVVGGGAGGATAAHYIKKGAPNLDVMLIEANPRYSSSFFSNLYIGGFRTFESLGHGYGGLRKLGIRVVHDRATDVDTTRKVVRTQGGLNAFYDRLVLSPGIDIKYNSIPGYSREPPRCSRTPTTPMAHRNSCSSGNSRQCEMVAWCLWWRRATRSAARRGPTSGPA